MDRLCKIRDLQRAVMRFEADFEAHYGISLNEGMTLCTLSGSERMCPGELGEAFLTYSAYSFLVKSIAFPPDSIKSNGSLAWNVVHYP